MSRPTAKKTANLLDGSGQQSTILELEGTRSNCHGPPAYTSGWQPRGLQNRLLLRNPKLISARVFHKYCAVHKRQYRGLQISRSDHVEHAGGRPFQFGVGS
jgi:hypothetical protein